MTSNRKLVLTDKAEVDMVEIFRHTRELWGVEQAENYQSKLEFHMSNLTRFPGIGTMRNEYNEGLRSLPAAEHVIFYKGGEDSVTVARILHKRVDSHMNLDG